MGKRLFLLVLLMVTSFPCSGCGGGGNPPPVQPTRATLKLGTSGPQGTQIAGINVNVTLPAGVSVPIADPATGRVVDGKVTLSGAAAILNTTSLTGATFVPAAGGGGTLNIVVAVSSGSGFGIGEFATVNCDVASGFFPSAADFSAVKNIARFLATDSSGQQIPVVNPTLTASIF